jgi:hypothetical protein
LLRIAAQAARPTVPPNSLKKLRVPVATAISLLFTLACIAIKLVWNVCPAPIPLKIWYPTSFAFDIVGEIVDKRPHAMAHIANPNHRFS